jgi:hypothetical protein
MPTATISNTLAASATLALAGVIALPMLGFARSNTAGQTAALNARTVASGIESLATDTRLYAPAFRTAPDGSITHYSALLVDGGYAKAADFTSPLAPDGGAPSAGGHVAQVDRLAFAANGAIMPPEPLQYSGTDRHYRLVSHASPAPQSGAWLTRPSDHGAPATTLLLTEWYAGDNWSALAQGRTVMSHRPIVPFAGATAGRSPEREPVSGSSDAPFAYPQPTDIFTDNAGFREVLTSHGPTEINAMGRSHPGGKAAMVMLDGSARLATPKQSVEQRLWGTTFHSITGGQGVR